MQIKLKALCLAMPMLVSAWANANIQIYPSKGIFGLEQPCRNDPSKYEANGSSIVCDFSQAIDNESIRKQVEQLFVQSFSVHDKFHRTLVLSGFFFLKIASTFLNSSFFPKPIKRRIAI